MHKDTRIIMSNLPNEFFIASRDSERRELHPDDARTLILQELEEMASRIREAVIITPELTRSGVYRVNVQFPGRTRRPFLGHSGTLFPALAYDAGEDRE